MPDPNSLAEEFDPLPERDWVLGGDVIARVARSLGSGIWQLTSPSLPKDWLMRLRSRSGTLYEVGDEAMVWIYDRDIRQRRIQVSDDEFGRLPVSDRMRPRYVQALRTLISHLSSNEQLVSLPPESLSEVKGMFNRCVRKDQHDWFQVYQALDAPPLPRLRVAACHLGDLSRAIRNADQKQARDLADIVLSLNLSPMLQRAMAQIETAAPQLEVATRFSRTPLSTSDTPQIIESETDSYIISRTAKSKQERANTVHRQTLKLLVEFLSKNGFTVE